MTLSETIASKKEWPSVSVVILNWNGFINTRLCLLSLLETSYPRLHIVVVDNGSKDDSVAQLKLLVSGKSNITLLENPNNDGFARGSNIGIRYAYEKGADYVLLLNNDSIVKPDFLEPAVEAAERDGSIGLVGGKIYLGRDGVRLWYAGGSIDLIRGQVMFRGFQDNDRGQYDRRESTGFVTGALMLIRRAVIEKVGMLPAEYFFGQEEWDYCLTVKRAGFGLLYVPEFTIHHQSDGSHSNADAKYVYNGYRNKLIFQQKFLPQQLWRLWLITFSAYSLTAARWQIQRVHGNNVDVDDLVFALRKAIEDHKTEGIKMITENDLCRFDAQLQARRLRRT